MKRTLVAFVAMAMSTAASADTPVSGSGSPEDQGSLGKLGLLGRENGEGNRGDQPL
jgi:hypothetical protein